MRMVSMALRTRQLIIGKKKRKLPFCKKISPGSLATKGIFCQNTMSNPNKARNTPQITRSFPMDSKPGTFITSD
jgi:hypothetical protein